MPGYIFCWQVAQMFGYIQLTGLFHSGPGQQSLAYFSAGLDFCFFCRVPTSEAELGGQAKEKRLEFSTLLFFNLRRNHSPTNKRQTDGIF